MTSTVHFIDLRATYKENFLAKLGRLMESAGLRHIVTSRDLVGVKLHFGEPGNTVFVKPVIVRKIIREIKNAGGVPFLTDTNTLYSGHRCHSPGHLTSAVQNGFAYSVVDAPIIIADGLRGGNKVDVHIGRKHFRKVHIASEIVHADALVSVAHFKCHELTGFAGTLKNLGMGCAARQGKLAQHSALSPKIKQKKCNGCQYCQAHCPAEAIRLDEDKAKINRDACIGCGECIIICPQKAVKIQWDQSIPVFHEKMIEYASGALSAKNQKALFLNFITDISPSCDCVPYNDAAIVNNIGVVASRDPVAIDQAAADLVNGAPALTGTCLQKNLLAGSDKFRGLYPKVDWKIQLEYAEKLGLGTRRYALNRV